MEVIRYAIYFTPTQGAFAEFGASWLGWDVETGRAMPMPGGLERDRWKAITSTPRKYGFHATLKPPFRLADGASVEGLEAAVAALAATQVPVELEGLTLSRLGHFLALTPTGDPAALNRLAAACVTELDGFRAPASEAELARRRAAGLSAGQEANLVPWGYPFVLDEFRFHMTLTGRLEEPVISEVESELSQRIAPVLPTPFRIDSLSLVGERADSRFQLLHRYALTG